MFKLKAPLRVTGTFTARQGSASPGRPAWRPGLRLLSLPAWQSLARWQDRHGDLQWRRLPLALAMAALSLALAVPVPLTVTVTRTVTVPLHYLVAA